MQESLEYGKECWLQEVLTGCESWVASETLFARGADCKSSKCWLRGNSRLLQEVLVARVPGCKTSQLQESLAAIATYIMG